MRSPLTDWTILASALGLLLVWKLLFTGFTAFAQVQPSVTIPQRPTKWYVSTSKGNSTNSGRDVLNPSNNLTAVLSRISAGAIVLLCQGDTFEGWFTVTLPNVVLGSYPCRTAFKGQRPLLTQGTTVLAPTSQTTVPNSGGYPLLVYNVSQFLTSPSRADLWAVWDPVNEHRYVRARFPNVVDPTKLYGTSTSEFLMAQSSTSSSILSPVTMKQRTTDYWVNATVHFRIRLTMYEAFTVSAVDTSTGRLMFDRASLWNTLTDARGFYLEHGMEELDAPGEFFLNKTSGLLYVIPVSPTVTVSRLVLIFGSQRNTSLDGNDYFANGAPPIITSSAANLTIQNLHLRYGFVGMRLDGVNSNIFNTSIGNFLHTGVLGNFEQGRIVNATITDCDNRSVNVTGPLDISYSTVRRTNMVTGSARSSIAIAALSMTARYNEIYDSGCIGIGTLYNSTVEHNLIQGAAITTGTCAGIQGNNENETFSTNVLLRNNTITGVTSNMLSFTPGTMVGPISVELPNCAANWTLDSNIITTDIRALRAAFGPTYPVGTAVRNIRNSNLTLINNRVLGTSQVHIRFVNWTDCAVPTVTVQANRWMLTSDFPLVPTPVLIQFASFVAGATPAVTSVLPSFTSNVFYATSPVASWTPIAGASVNMSTNTLMFAM